MTIRSPDSMKSAMVRSLGGQYGGYESTSMHAWTNGGNDVNHRSLMDFDLSSIISGSTISSATLYLYGDANPTTMPNGNSQMSGSNDCYLRRITSIWDESTVDWNSIPSTSSTNEVSIPASSASVEDFVIDITAIIQDIVNDPSNSHGFMIQLQTESAYRSRQFASSDVADTTLHPKLVVNFDPSTAITEHKGSVFFSTVHPNPFSTSGILRFENSSNLLYTVEIINMVGQKVNTITGVTSGEVTLERDGLQDGIYFLPFEERRRGGKLWKIYYSLELLGKSLERCLDMVKHFLRHSMVTTQ